MNAERGRMVLSPDERCRVSEYARSPFIPALLERSIEQFISRKVGKPWNDAVILERIRAAIRDLKADYWRGRTKKGDLYASGYRVIAYLAYHLPVCYAQFRWLMGHMAAEGLLPEDMAVLDVGTGPGAVPLAICDFMRTLGRGSAKIFSVEREREHIEAFRSILPPCIAGSEQLEVMPPIEADLVHPPRDRMPAGLDLIVFSNVLNELDLPSMKERAAVVSAYAELLDRHGTIAIVEPADLDNSAMLRSLVREVIRGTKLNIYEPCSFPWGRDCRVERCWSFMRLSGIGRTSLMDALSHAPDAFRYINTDIKFSHALIRRDGQTKVKFTLPKGAKYAPLSNLGRHVGRRINVIASVMSSDLGDAGHHVFLICDGTSQKPVFAIMPLFHESGTNLALLKASYGDLLGFRGVLVKFNRAEDAFNLLVQRGSDVYPLGDETR